MLNPSDYSNNLSFFENQIDYSFNNRELLVQAFTSKGFSNEYPGTSDCVSLAALGDGVIRVLAVQRAIELGYSSKGQINDFSKIFAEGSKQGDFFWMAFGTLSIEETEILRLSKGEYRLLHSEDKSFLEQFFEALIGAIYLDSNIDETRRVFIHLISFFILYYQRWLDGF